uniref:J domain-containing protein-like n=1 Tax=Ciona intestinalis TaxID=7719 RepID=F6UVD1_CIOIN|nr:J domain-containing protein-like [Ciona intestinalis]|eukprot:XP_002125650.1 J domain-containing protein-like [Ciona intestinalis]
MDVFKQIFSEDNNTEDYYDVLGCNELSNTNQILTEYRIKAKLLHPDKNKGNSNSSLEFAKLQKAKEVLADPTLRKEYDLWRNSGLKIPYERWKSMQGRTRMTMHWVQKVKHDPMLEPAENGSESAGPSNSASSSVSNRPSDDILKQFRAYEI